LRKIGPNNIPILLAIISVFLMIDGFISALYGNLGGFICLFFGAGLWFRYKISWVILLFFNSVQMFKSLYVIIDHFLRYKLHMIKTYMSYINYNKLYLNVVSVIITILLFYVCFHPSTKEYFGFVNFKKNIIILICLALVVSTALYIINFQKPWKLY